MSLRPLALLAAFALAACTTPSDPPAPEAAPDSAAQHLRVIVTETLVPAARRQAFYFGQRQNGTTTTDLESRSTRGAYVALLSDSVHAILVDRPPNAEEQASLDRRFPAPLRIHIGTGALALVVHPSNPLDSLALGAVPRLIGRAATWGETVPGGLDRRVELVATGRNSGLYEVAATRFAGTSELALGHLAPSQDSVLAYVARRPGALGLVSLEALRDTVLARGVKVLAVRGDSGAATRPSQWSVYDKVYPLRYEAYYLTTRPQRSVEARFATFLRSDVGQRAVQMIGLVPATIPAYRFVVTQ